MLAEWPKAGNDARDLLDGKVGGNVLDLQNESWVVGNVRDPQGRLVDLPAFGPGKRFKADRSSDVDQNSRFCQPIGERKRVQENGAIDIRQFGKAEVLECLMPEQRAGK